MKRALAAIAIPMALWSCAPVLEPDAAGQIPTQGTAVPDAQTAMAVARKVCHVATWQRWLSPYRWHVALHDGIWHVRVPSLNYGLDCAYYDVDIRAADGTAGRCDTCPVTVVIAGAK